MANARAVATEGVETTKGWFDSIKEKLNIDVLSKKLNLSRDRLIEMGIYLLIGFIAGFLFKKYARYLVVVVLTLVGLVILQQFGFVTFSVHWLKIQGFQPVAIPTGADAASMASLYWGWIKTNFAVVLSFSVGFFVGLKVG